MTAIDSSGYEVVDGFFGAPCIYVERVVGIASAPPLRARRFRRY
jgi:hypothetical protein